MTGQSVQLDVNLADEAELVAAAQRNPRAFGPLYDLYVQPVYRYLYSRLEGGPEAEEVTAQTFLAALEALGNYRHNGHFAAWLFSIARRKAADAFRQRSRQVPLADAERVPSEADPLAQVIRTERSAALAALIRALPEEEREWIRLRYVADLSFAEMAQLLGRNEDAVKKSLYRLLARLQSQLEDSHD
jgi:RNA polymerase sigma-70 factor (ECF subfamily)